MTFVAPPDALIARARAGDLAAIDALLLALQPGVYNLAVRMLGNREDARDATQEILLKVVTHLGGFRSEARFTTWVWQIARHHLLDVAATRSREAPVVSFETLGEELAEGIAHTAGWLPQPLTPEAKADARQIAIGCSQGMLMRLDRDHRLAWILDATFGLSSQEAAEVLGIAPAAYRKRLSRARQALDEFAQGHCGLAAPATAACRCERQADALRAAAAAGRQRAGMPLRLESAERQQAEHLLDAVEAMSGIAGVLRAHPDYQAPEALRGAIRAVLAGSSGLAGDHGAH